MMVISRIKGIAQKNISKFLYANALYTLSTGLISLLSPFIMKQDAYEQFIYIFQNIMFLCSVFSLGLVPTLLTYYKYDNDRYRSYFLSTCLCIILIIVFIGFFPSNIISRLIKIVPSSLSESIVIYISVACQLIFIFNRGVMTAEESYRKMNVTIGIIFILRILAILYTYLNPSLSLRNIILIICVLPMIIDLVRFIISTHKINFNVIDGKYYDFISFSIKIFLVGVIYTITNRLFVINAKGVDETLAAVVSFSSGTVGIISIFNTTFASYFIGKLDRRSSEGVLVYLKKVRRFSPLFIACTLSVVLVISGIVYVIYPYNAFQAAIYSGLTIFFAAMMFLISLWTLLCKTYNMLNLQLILNIICCFSVFLALKLMSGCNYYLLFCMVNLLLLLTEIVLAIIVERRINKDCNVSKL